MTSIVKDTFPLWHPKLWKWSEVAWRVGVLVNVARSSDATVARVSKRDAATESVASDVPPQGGYRR